VKGLNSVSAVIRVPFNLRFQFPLPRKI